MYKKHNNRVDGCQLFYHDRANVCECDVCGYHISSHKPSSSILITKNIVVNTASSSQCHIMFIDDDDEYLKKLLTKRLELNDVVSNFNVTPLSFINVKLEFIKIRKALKLQTYMFVIG